MQVVSFRKLDSSGPLEAGFSDGRSVVRSTDIGYPSSVRELLLATSGSLSSAVDLARVALAAGDGSIDLKAVYLGPPVPDPDKIICIGVNYHEHADESAQEVTEFPPIFAKYRNALIGADDAVVMPGISEQIDYEAELAVIIGTQCKNVSTENALEHVAGFAVFNDVSARDIQLRSSQWTPGKMLDTFAPMGPGITPKEFVRDVQNLRISARINGVTMQDSTTSKMIWPVADIVSYLSAMITLEPGDIIATGTPAGVGMAQTPPLWLKPGDLVEIEIEDLGIVSNTVVASTVVAK